MWKNKLKLIMVMISKKRKYHSSMDFKKTFNLLILKFKKGFTLLELIIVIAIIAILSVMVFVFIDPITLFKETRDSQRLSDLDSIDRALSIFNAERPDAFFGNPNVLYISLPDNLSTSCGSYSLPALPPTWSYACVTEENLTRSNGTGWIPVNFSQAVSVGPILTTLPIDPVNSVVGGHFYGYSKGSWQLIAFLESGKYIDKSVSDRGLDPKRYEIGSRTNLIPVFVVPEQQQTISYVFSVSKSGSGSGTVTSSPVGINCGATCSASYNENIVINLTANVALGSTFAGWSGDADCVDGSVTMNAAKSCTATFDLIFYNLSVSKSGSGSGTVTSSPAGINCGATCSALYNENTVVTLTAAATTGIFNGWSGGGCTGTGTCIVTMNSVKSITANFIQLYNITHTTNTDFNTGTHSNTAVKSTGVAASVKLGNFIETWESAPSGSITPGNNIVADNTWATYTWQNGGSPSPLIQTISGAAHDGSRGLYLRSYNATAWMTNGIRASLASNINYPLASSTAFSIWTYLRQTMNPTGYDWSYVDIKVYINDGGVTRVITYRLQRQRQMVQSKYPNTSANEYIYISRNANANVWWQLSRNLYNDFRSNLSFPALNGDEYISNINIETFFQQTTGIAQTAGYFDSIYLGNALTGNYTSSVLDTGQTSVFTTLGLSTILPANTAITLDIRAGSSATAPAWGVYDANWPVSALLTNVVNGGNLSALNGYRYVQYRANLSTTNNLATPSLDGLTINYQY